MSLRAFHLFFIGVSVALAAFFAAWAASQYRAGHELVYALAAVGAVAACGALIAYGAAFQRKTRHLIMLLVVLAAPRAAYACPVCFGQSDSPMASAANLSILVMLIITLAMLVAFASFFIVLMRRARAAAAAEGRAEAGPYASPAEAGLHVRSVEEC
jgi:hypothetical protein